MKDLWPYCEPLPASEVGARLCKTFNYTWNAILKVNETLEPWQTVTKYPLKPRVLWRFYQDAGYLVGVRFDDTTQYALIDVDWLSPYHPQQSADGIRRIQAALETIGICRTFCTRSSDSKGIHLWVPLATSVPTFWLATALKACLESHGLQVKQGELETFPNCKAYAIPGEFSDYQAHRLPLQPASGAALLNDDLAVIPGGLNEFFQQWDWATGGQDLPLLIEAIALAKALRRHRRYGAKSAKVTDWRRDLETEITDGWTGHGQTNHLLKTIACYGVVFQALSGERLEQYVLCTVDQSPGYREWCRHQHEIKDRIHAWARIAEGYYWALGTQSTRQYSFNTTPENNIVPFDSNQQRADDARARIQAAVEQLEAAHSLPNGVRQRMAALAQTAKCSNQTLQKVKELWHPNCRQSNSQPQKVLVEVSAGSVCNGDRESDRDEKRLLEPKPSKPQNADQSGMLHTLSPHMKGGAGEERSGKTNKNLRTLFSLREDNSKTAPLPPRPGTLPLPVPELPLPVPELPVKPVNWEHREADSVVPPTAPTPVVTPNSRLQDLLETPGAPPPTTARPLLKRQAQPGQGNQSQPVTSTPTRGTGGLTGLPSLLQRVLPKGSNNGNGKTPQTPPTEPIRLPSDPLPEPKPGSADSPSEPPVSAPPTTGVRRRETKSGIDPQVLPPHATYIASPIVHPAIAPGTVLSMTNAVRDLLQHLQVEYQWTTETVQDWIAAHFDGRRRSQLSDQELPLLLERLQAYWQQQSGGGDPQEGTQTSS